LAEAVGEEDLALGVLGEEDAEDISVFKPEY